MTFADGAPIDAAQLTALETTLNEVKASIPKIGTGTGAIAPVIYGGMVSGVSVTKNIITSFTIDYSAAQLSTNPTAIVLTPVHSGSTSNYTIIQPYVVSGSVSPTTAKCEVTLNTGASTTSLTSDFYYIVICH